MAYDFQWDMESNPTTPWDFTGVADPTTDITRETGAAHDGTYGLQVVLNDTSDHYVEKTGLSYTSSIYTECWWFGSSDLTASGCWHGLMEYRLAADWLCYTLVGSTSGGNAVLNFQRNKPGFGAIGTSVSVSLNAWHLLKMVVTGIGTASGVFQLWVDDVKQLEETGVDLSAGYTITAVEWGRTATSGGGATPVGTLFYDTGWVDADGVGGVGPSPPFRRNSMNHMLVR